LKEQKEGRPPSLKKLRRVKGAEGRGRTQEQKAESRVRVRVRVRVRGRERLVFGCRVFMFFSFWIGFLYKQLIFNE
jgi:hypothetical protein